MSQIQFGWDDGLERIAIKMIAGDPGDSDMMVTFYPSEKTLLWIAEAAETIAEHGIENERALDQLDSK